MNIRISHSWLTEYIKTDATPQDIANALSLCSASIEKIDKIRDDLVYDIEVTTNRIDMLSVYGLAREAAVVLPRFGFEAKLLPYPRGISIPKVSKDDSILKVKIGNKKLCPRFTVILLENITVKPSPNWITDRLEKSGIRSLNNVVDIANYTMIETGHPMHTFDYDKIKAHLMIMRESRMGETLVTLDCVKRILPEGAIIIEDGGKNIIDLCGIMGGENSAIDDKTKRVLLFVQTYNPVHIRRTCQKLSLRTDAATRFEKWVDPEGVPQSLERATKLLIDVAAAKIHGKVIDIYNIPYSPKSLAVHKKKIDQLLGVKISLKDIVDILSLLQFKIKVVNQTIIVTVPSFRAQDIIIPEDIIEEVARIYGYHNLPTVLPEGQIPNIPTDWGLYWETRVKNALKFWGFTESYTYSLVSNNLLTRAKEDPRDVLRIQNPLTEDNKFLRPHLLPSLLEMVAKNQIQGERAHIFEIGMTYLKQKVGKLPKEKPQLAIVASGRDYLSIKGVIEKIWEEIGRNDFSVSPISKEEKVPLFDQQKSAVLCHNIGILGEIKKEVLDSFGIKGGITACELDCEKLFALATTKRTYISPSKFPYVLEDLTFIKNIPNIFASDIILAIKEVSKLIVDVRIHTMYKNTITLSLSYQSLTKTLTNKDLELIRQQIVKILERKFQLTLKGIV